MFNNAFATLAMFFSAMYRFAKSFDNIGRVAEMSSDTYAARYAAENEQILAKLEAETTVIKAQAVETVQAVKSTRVAA
jgi:hypothetical protein